MNEKLNTNNKQRPVNEIITKPTRPEDEGLGKIVSMLEKIPHCEGIVFNGSRLNGNGNEDSDYDFTVLVSKGESYYKIWRYENCMVDVCCVTLNKVKENDLVKTRNSNAELYIIATGQIVLDKNGKLKEIQDEAKKIWSEGPEQISEAEINEVGYAFKTYLDDIKSLENSGNEGYYFQGYVIQNVVKFFFRLYGKWQTRPRDIEQDIKNIDSGFWELYKDANINIGQDKNIAIIKMLEYLIKKFNLPQTGEIYFEKK
ncbi:MAG: hypothetical protein V1867_04130 [Candidatus Falkowbacteria bacterium]